MKDHKLKLKESKFQCDIWVKDEDEDDENASNLNPMNLSSENF